MLKMPRRLRLEMRMGEADSRLSEVARAEWGVEHQIIHDLIISLTDRLLAPASPLGELKQVDLLIIERAAQDRESDCGRQKEYRQVRVQHLTLCLVYQ